MIRVLTVLSCSLFISCGGEKDNSQLNAVQEQLRDCRVENQKIVAELEQLKTTAGQSVNVEIEGDIVTIVGKTSDKSSGNGGGGTAGVKERTLALNKNVRTSRAGMQRCYQTELKKNDGLQGRPVTLRVQTTFDPSGTAKRVSLSPSISTPFDACMKKIAMKWKVPAAPGSHSIAAKVNLSPQ